MMVVQGYALKGFTALVACLRFLLDRNVQERDTPSYNLNTTRAVVRRIQRMLVRATIP